MTNRVCCEWIAQTGTALFAQEGRDRHEETEEGHRGVAAGRQPVEGGGLTASL